MGLHHTRAEPASTDPPLVLIHGLASHGPAFDRIVPALRDRFDVLAVDLPGFGRSPEDGTPPTIEGQADRVERFFGEAGVERPHVVGFSMGGAIALELARRGAVRSVTAIAPVGFWTPRERAYSVRSLRAAVALGRLVEPVAAAILGTAAGRTLFFSQTWGRPWRMTPQEALAALEAAITSTRFEACADAFSEYMFHDAEELRGVPITIAWGEKDRLLLYRQAARARRVLPWARHVTLTGCGHVPFTDDPEQVTAVVLAGAQAPSPAPVPA